MATQCREQQRKRKNKIATIRAYAMLVVVFMIGSVSGFFIGRVSAPEVVKTETITLTDTVEVPVYRTVIAEADSAFVQAGAYLCIGYGFNDEHIQPKLLTQISKGKPIVVLARTMTAACRKHIADAGIQKYLIFERADDAHTRVYGNGWEETYDGAYWSLDNFLKIW